jgi:hypothetical protein
MIARVVALLWTLCSTAAGVQDSYRFIVAQAIAGERVVGLLALPEVFGDHPCELFQPKPLEIHAAASANAPTIAIIERVNPPRPPAKPDCDEPEVAVRPRGGGPPAPLPYDESGYEYSKAVVFERAGSWYRIALMKGSGWIERRNPEAFMAYPESFATDSLATYLREGWDGNVWAEPGEPAGRAAPREWQAHRNEEIPVQVLGSRVVRRAAWIQIRFLAESCGTSLGNLPALAGWVPAHRTSRATSVWFYSRGC